MGLTVLASIPTGLSHREIIAVTPDSCQAALRKMSQDSLFVQRVRWDGYKWHRDTDGPWWFMGYIPVDGETCVVMQNWNPLEPVFERRGP